MGEASPLYASLRLERWTLNKFAQFAGVHLEMSSLGSGVYTKARAVEREKRDERERR
jgi:hypothetical protein